MEGLRKEENPDKLLVNQVDKELSIIGIRYQQRIARDRKVWWKPRPTRNVVLDRKKKK